MIRGDLTSRLAHTYRTGLKLIGSNRSVRVHVARDVYDAMRKLATVPSDDLIPHPTLWGFPLLIEEAWESGRIVVRADEEIW